MTRNSLFAIGLIAATTVGSMAYAAGSHGSGAAAGSLPDQNKPMNQGPGHGMMGGTSQMGGMMQMMKQMHGQMPGGMMGGTGPMGAAMMQEFDTDGDGTVSPEEARVGLETLLVKYDADGDGTLSIAEFETLHSANIRDSMVDRFQYLDANGDGQVTSDEMAAQAARMEQMQKLRAQMMSGSDHPQNKGSNHPMMNNN